MTGLARAELLRGLVLGTGLLVVAVAVPVITGAAVAAGAWTQVSVLVLVLVLPVAAVLGARLGGDRVDDALLALGVRREARVTTLMAGLAGRLGGPVLAVLAVALLRVAAGATGVVTGTSAAVALVVAVAGTAVVAFWFGLRIAHLHAAVVVSGVVVLIDVALRLAGQLSDLPDWLRSVSFFGAARNLAEDRATVRLSGVLGLAAWAALLPVLPHRLALPRGFRRPAASLVAVGLAALVGCLACGAVLPRVITSVLPYDLQPQWLQDSAAGRNAEDVVSSTLARWRAVGPGRRAGPFSAVVRHRPSRIKAGVGGLPGVVQVDFAETTLWACLERDRRWRLVRLVSRPEC